MEFYLRIGLYFLFLLAPFYFLRKRLIKKLMRGSETKKVRPLKKETRKARHKARKIRPLQVTWLSPRSKVPWQKANHQKIFRRITGKIRDFYLIRLLATMANAITAYAILGLRFIIIGPHEAFYDSVIALNIIYVVIIILISIVIYLSKKNPRFDPREDFKATISLEIFFHIFVSFGVATGLTGTSFQPARYLIAAPLPILVYYITKRFLSKRLRYPRVPRADLLMLRVFNTGKSGYIYHKIEPIWNFLGSTFLISSEDHFYDFETRYDRRYIRRVMWGYIILSCIGFLICLEFSQVSFGNFILFLIAYSLFCFILLRGSYKKMMESAYIKSKGDVDVQLTLSRLHQKNGLDRYSNEQLNCQGESWKNVVQKLLKQCSTVLIDVRGFTSANKGISYELGIVLDMFPVERLLIIMDKTTDRNAFLKLLHETWQTIDTKSPNRNAKSIRIFKASKLRVRTCRKIVQHLLSQVRTIDDSKLDRKRSKRKQCRKY